MAARLHGLTKIKGTDWDDAVQTAALPLLDTGNAKVTYNSTSNRWEFYIGGAKVAELDADGNMWIKGEVQSLTTF
jgi:hypothetical protein